MPAVSMFVTVIVLTHYGRGLLTDAAAGRGVSVSDGTAILLIGAFLLACASVVVLQSARLAGRIAGPERRLVQALHRIRAGDVAFRVNLRRGDLLGGLATECNALLEWLNANPPAGVRTGSDVVEVPVAAPEEALT